MAKVVKVTELWCAIPNKPGEVANIIHQFAEAKINIVATMSWLSATDPHKCYYKIVTLDTARSRQLLKSLGYRVLSYRALLIDLPNKPGSFYPLADKFARAKINIKYHYATTGGSKAQMVVATSNDPKAMRITKRYRG